MEFVSPRHRACVLAGVAVLISACGSAAAAQDVVGAPDPAAPLAPMSDLGVDWPDLATPDAIAGDPAVPPEQEGERRYRVTLAGLDGVGDARLRERFDALSALVLNADDPANVAQIDRRAREDEALLGDLLRSYGYYDATVTARVAREGTVTVVTLQAEPGALYRIGDIQLTGLPSDDRAAGELSRAFPVKPGDPLNAENVLAAEAGLKAELGREGFAFAETKPLEVVVDHASKTANISLPVEAGAAQRFGKITVEGKQLFSARHLTRIARFKEGDPFDTALLDDLRRALIATSLVSVAEIKPRPSAQPGVVDIAVRLERAPRRTVAAEAGYGTGEGARLEVSWQHRNLIRPEGAVTFRGVAGTQEQMVSAVLRRSNFRRRDQVLTGQATASHTKRDAYDAKTFTLAGGIERLTNIIWQKTWTWSFGGELVASDERDTIGPAATPRRRTFFIAAVPTSLAYDGSDDLLDPTRGYRLAARLSPELSLQSGVFGYARAQIDASAYLPVTAGTSLAGRVRLGSLPGAARDRIAPSRRFYSGGGGSVRGYSYQGIGPRDADNDPIGGRSLAEFALEARIRFGDFGVVPFVDGGNLYSKALPDFSGLRFGAGLGARYYTSFGPIRVDVGTPINPRSGDSRVSVYVSLGQAF